MPAFYLLRRRQLGERLRELRQLAGMSGNRLAQQLGWVQSKVSKIETGKQLPTEQDVRSWLDAVGAPETADELLALVAQSRVEYASYRGGTVDDHNVETQRNEAEATRLAVFLPAMIPGLLQTAEYARELLHLPSGPLAFGRDEADLDRTLASRMQRQEVLYQPGRRIQVVLLEAALRCRLCSAGALAGQLDRLIAVAGLPGLELGIVPDDAAVPVYPLSGFTLIDDDLVRIETLTGVQQLGDPDEIQHYQRAFELLRGVALHGRQAVPLIQRALRQLESELFDDYS